MKMNPNQIKEFFERLEGPEGCNFRQDDEGKYHWDCGGGEDKTKSKSILAKMGISESQAKAFLATCETYGAYCDCEICLNFWVINLCGCSA